MIEPMAARDLTWIEGERRPVRVRLWAPVAYDSRDWVCDFAIDGLPEAVRTYALGVDSLQAVTVAIRAIRTFLVPHRDKLAWLDEPGWLGIPYQLNLHVPAEERRLETLLENEIARYLDIAGEPVRQWEARLRAAHDPDVANPVYDRCSTAELIAMLRAASARERAARSGGNSEAVHVFTVKRFPMMEALRSRADASSALRELSGLTADDDRAAALQAAKVMAEELGDASALERLAADAIPPESAEAAAFMDFLRRNAERPKPWDVSAPHERLRPGQNDLER